MWIEFSLQSLIQHKPYRVLPQQTLPSCNIYHKQDIWSHWTHVWHALTLTSASHWCLLCNIVKCWYVADGAGVFVGQSISEVWVLWKDNTNCMRLCVHLWRETIDRSCLWDTDVFTSTSFSFCWQADISLLEKSVWMNVEFCSSLIHSVIIAQKQQTEETNKIQ